MWEVHEESHYNAIELMEGVERAAVEGAHKERRARCLNVIHNAAILLKAHYTEVETDKVARAAEEAVRIADKEVAVVRVASGITEKADVIPSREAASISRFTEDDAADSIKEELKETWVKNILLSP